MMTTKLVNGQVVDITGTPEETAILAEWTDNEPGVGAKWLAVQESALTALREQAKTVFAESNVDPQSLARACRAFALITLSEVNLLRQWLASFKAEVAAATSLANLKTRVAGLPNTPDRTAVQLKQAIRDQIDLE